MSTSYHLRCDDPACAGAESDGGADRWGSTYGAAGFGALLDAQAAICALLNSPAGYYLRIEGDMGIATETIDFLTMHPGHPISIHDEYGRILSRDGETIGYDADSEAIQDVDRRMAEMAAQRKEKNDEQSAT